MLYIPNPKNQIIWNIIVGMISGGKEFATVHPTIIPTGGTNHDANKLSVLILWCLTI